MPEFPKQLSEQFFCINLECNRGWNIERWPYKNNFNKKGRSDY